MNNLNNSLILCNSFREQITQSLKEIVGSKLFKIEYVNELNEVKLTFRLSDNNNFKSIKLKNCYAFKDFGIFDMQIELALVKEPGHFFREYCKLHNIEFQFSHQLEIYPQGFKSEINEEVSFRTFFAVCESIEFVSSLGEIEF